MKRFWLLLIIFLPIITGCATVPKNEIILPPKPQRTEIPEVKTVQDMALVIEYYESLVESWEAWGEKTSELVEN